MAAWKKLTSLLAATAFVLTLGGSAQASHCGTPVVLNSAYGDDGAGAMVPGPQPNPFPACSAEWLAPQEVVDTRMISPGATHVSVSVLADLGVQTIQATVNGMGFSNHTTVLQRTVLPGGGVLYSGAWLAIPTGPAVQGQIAVSSSGYTTVFRTIP